MENITEGTWSTPDTEEKIEQAKELVDELQSIKIALYNIAGSDKIYNGLDVVIDEIQDMIAYGEESIEEELFMESSAEVDANAYEIYPETIGDREKINSLLEGDHFPYDGWWDGENGRFVINKSPKYFPNVLEVLDSYLVEDGLHAEINEIIIEDVSIDMESQNTSTSGIWVFPINEEHEWNMTSVFGPHLNSGAAEWDPTESGYYFFADDCDVETLRHRLETEMDQYGLRGDMEIV